MSEKPHTSVPDRFKIMRCAGEILIDDGYIVEVWGITPDTTFSELGMDSLDIARFVSDCENYFNVDLDTEEEWPKNIADLVMSIELAFKQNL